MGEHPSSELLNLLLPNQQDRWSQARHVGENSQGPVLGDA